MNNVIEIVETGLKASGLDGLIVPGVCACIMGDISPGGCLNGNCNGAYKHMHSNGQDWITSLKKEAVTDADIEQCIAECS